MTDIGTVMKPSPTTVICAPKEGFFVVKGEEGLKVMLEAIAKAWKESRCFKIEADGVLFVPDELRKLLNDPVSSANSMERLK